MQEPSHSPAGDISQMPVSERVDVQFSFHVSTASPYAIARVLRDGEDAKPVIRPGKYLGRKQDIKIYGGQISTDNDLDQLAQT